MHTVSLQGRRSFRSPLEEAKLLDSFSDSQAFFLSFGVCSHLLSLVTDPGVTTAMHIGRAYLKDV